MLLFLWSYINKKNMARKKKRILDVIKSPVDNRDFLAESVYATYALPTKIDHRDKLGSIRDQGSQGACAGFAGSCMKEVQEVIDVELEGYLSPQFIYNNRSDQDIEGMYMRDLMKILRHKGVCKEKTYKYGKRQAPDAMPQKAFDEAKDYIVKSYASINTVQACKTALHKDGPVVLAVPVYHYDGDIWKPKNFQDPLLGGHAMCIVGYDDAAQHFIVRNSWSADWGDNGYTYFPYTDWGLQWEAWGTIDEESSKPEPPPEPPKPKPKCNWWCRFKKWFRK